MYILSLFNNNAMFDPHIETFSLHHGNDIQFNLQFSIPIDSMNVYYFESTQMIINKFVSTLIQTCAKLGMVSRSTRSTQWYFQQTTQAHINGCKHNVYLYRHLYVQRSMFYSLSHLSDEILVVSIVSILGKGIRRKHPYSV